MNYYPYKAPPKCAAWSNFLDPINKKTKSNITKNLSNLKKIKYLIKYSLLF